VFFVFFGVGNQGPRGQGQTWGVNCGEFAWGSFWGAQTLGALRGGEIVSGLPLFEKNGIESHYLPPPTHYLPPPCHVQIYSFFSRLHLNIKCTWRGRGEYSEYCTRFWQANSHTTSRQCPGQSPVFVSVSAIDKKHVFCIFRGGKSRSEGSGSNLGGSTVGSLPEGPSGEPRLWGLCAGGEIVSGLPLFERNGIESTVRIMATHALRTKVKWNHVRDGPQAR